MKQSLKKKLMILAVAFFCLFFSFNTFAAKVTNFSVTLSSNDINTAVDQTIRFTTPSGVAAGQSITLTFASEFDVGLIDDSDIDLHDDGADVSLAPVASGADWGASFSGQTLTITSGTEAIAAGSIITVEIGLNATFQSNGDQQIKNPLIQGVYSIDLAGTFGDFGQANVIILNNSSIGVTARVGTGGGPGGDTTAPIISNVQIINITTNSATVTWLTNEASTSAVDYGLTVSYEIGSVSVIEYVTFHSLDMINLSPDTTYHLQVLSRDNAGNLAVSGDYTFKTLSEEDLYLNLRAVPEKRLPSAGNNGTILQVKIFHAGTANLVVQSTTTTDANGYDNKGVSLAGITFPATFDLIVKGYSHLQHRKNNVVFNDGTEFVDFSEDLKIFEKAGDVNGANGDNYVNGLDLSVLANKIYTDDYRADLNQDKIINGLEFAISVTNLFNWGDF